MTTHMVDAYIAFGANLGQPAQQFIFACDAIDAIPQTSIQQRSSLYRSAPIGVCGHNDYINAVIAVQTRQPPETLLQHLLAIETRGGRVRPQGQVMAPRTLDLDLLLYGEYTYATAQLTLPHPRMHLRAFVLQPLLEIAPHIRIPNQVEPRQLLEQLSEQRIEKIA